MKRRLLALLLIALTAPAAAQRFDAHRSPAPQPAAEAVGVPASAWQHITLDGPQGRRYRIAVAAIGAAPAAGYPALLLLDGNAAEAALRAAPSATPLPGSVLLVAVGYDGEAYFDGAARTVDYTPPRRDGQPAIDPRGRVGGGAEGFLDFLEHGVLPQLAARWPLDRQRLGLWGHSFGGLLALHAFYQRPGLFDFHAAASPSLWWQAPLLDEAAEAYLAAPAHRATHLLLMAGSAERGGPAALASPLDTPPAAQRLAQRLRAVPGLDVRWRGFDGLGHGAMFSASLGPAIRAFVATETAPLIR